MGGVCITLYGFIAVSGLKMLQPVDLNENRNLFTASVIFISGIGGMVLKIGDVTLTEVACALILGIITNLILRGRKSATSSLNYADQTEIVSLDKRKPVVDNKFMDAAEAETAEAEVEAAADAVPETEEGNE